jgi:hypothetical protein
MKEDLIKIDKDFSDILNKHLSNLPKFENKDDYLNILNRLEYTSKNNLLEKELKEYILHNNLKSDGVNYLLKFYTKKYSYGFNFPAAIERYTSLLQNQQQ